MTKQHMIIVDVKKPRVVNIKFARRSTKTLPKKKQKKQYSRFDVNLK